MNIHGFNCILFYACAATLCGCAAGDGNSPCGQGENLTQYVNPLIGTAYVGHTFPGPSVPFGGVQPGPDTAEKGGHWDYCAGYKYEDDTIYSFSQTHMNGTGCPDLGDIAIMPYVGEIGSRLPSDKYDKESQIARAGYYKVKLKESGASVEISATEHACIYRITFEKDGGKILLDLQKGMAGPPRVVKCSSRIVGNNKIEGECRVKGFIPMRDIAFAMEFDRPITEAKELPQSDPKELGQRYAIDFGLKKGDVLTIKIGISSVDAAGANLNLQTEIPHWDFDAVRDAAEKKWDAVLSRVQIEGSRADKENFYTSMYHLFLQPNNIADVDGAYRATKTNQKKISPTKNYYSSWSIWDTYRAAHSMYTILSPEYVDDFVESMMLHYSDMGFLPINVYYGKETYCMIGNHAISIISESIMKGFYAGNAAKALDAMVVSSTKNLPKSQWDIYEKYGYYPFDIVKNESVSRTLESCYNDYCIALVAQKLARQDISGKFSKRSLFYKNLFDSETKFMRGKDSKGNFRTPFNPFDFAHDGTFGGDYTEGSAWQYTWHVQQDVEGLIEMFGGKKPFVDRLSELFVSHDIRGDKARKSLDITGLIGQYVHGNEPSHHIIYLFTLADAPRKTAELVREVFDRFYMNKPDGLCGNDDCGQMSAWYMFSAFGFYPVNPASGEYVLGAPQIKGAKLNLRGGKTFEIKADNLSKENKYVKSIRLNGKDISGRKTITYAEIMAGGILEFDMSNR